MELETDTVLSFQVNQLFRELNHLEGLIGELQEMIKIQAVPFMKEIDILTSMKGISVFIAIAIITDIIKVDRFVYSPSKQALCPE